MKLETTNPNLQIQRREVLIWFKKVKESHGSLCLLEYVIIDVDSKTEVYKRNLNGEPEDISQWLERVSLEERSRLPVARHFAELGHQRRVCWEHRGVE